MLNPNSSILISPIAAMKTNVQPSTPLPNEALQTLGRIKTAARLALGFVWVWEGLVPKILFPSHAQFEMVRQSGWWTGSPEQTLFWLGAAMIPAGLAIMIGLWEKIAAAVATISVLVLMVLVIGTNPAALHDPYGGLAKDACLFVCAALVWWWPETRKP
jgi:uncharacterized membrane protein YphA (DoxX/SURF4 family)